MINVIDELIAIEKRANKILTDAQKNKDLLIQIDELILAELKQKIDELADFEINSIAKKNLSLQNQQVEKIKSDANNFAIQMKNDFANKKNEWLENIFNCCLED